jgi:dTDP-4-dehydrorhamnose 3,5-epimerase
MNSYKDFEGVKLVQKKKHEDVRGSFLKAFDKTLVALTDFEIQQANVVNSKHKDTVRGLHYQEGSFSERKFFSVLQGAIQLVFVDLRKNSDSFKRHSSVILDTAEIGVDIPRGFATGYCTLVSDATVLYFSDNKYDLAHERGIRWNDPYFEINWETQTPFLSDKDMRWPNWINT